MPRTRLQPKRRHFKLTIAYDGTNYAGWQLQPNGSTVQEVSRGRVGKDRRWRGARPWFGPHGRGSPREGAGCQLLVPHCTDDGDAGAGVERQSSRGHSRATGAGGGRAISRPLLGEGEGIPLPDRPWAVADPFLRAYAWHHPRPLNVAAMRRATRVLKGRHDFAALSANPMRPVETTVRTVSRLSVTKRGNLLTIAVVADGFLYKMVRSIVGGFGEGRRGTDDGRTIAEAGKSEEA
jgi:tRNA pseudouridine38-40 synthase